jgi:hypothetical protein
MLSPSGLPLQSQHLADLQRSGLNADTIQAAALHSVETRRVRELLNWNLAMRDGLGACLAIPFFDLDGNGTSLVRLKPDQPRKDRDGKPIKYESPKGSTNLPYFPPLGAVLAAIKDPSQPLLITEGEKKALKAAQDGFACVGLVGVSGWSKRRPKGEDGRAKGRRELLDQLAALPLRGRAVFISYDSDAVQKIEVRREEWALAQALGDHGALVKVVRLPAGPPNQQGQPAKVGLDDYLVANGPPALRSLMAGAGAPEKPDAREAASAILARLPDVLAAGAPALFADRQLLGALARLKDTDPAAFAARRATLKGVVSLRDLDAALKPFHCEQARDRPPVLLGAAGYRIKNGRICREHGTRDGGTELLPLCNFTAQITEVLTRDDGAEQAAFFTVAGRLDNGRALPAVQVPAADFTGLGWITTGWHGEAVAFAGMGTRDHLRAAMELMSGDRRRRTVYAHTGWRKIGERWHYLHTDGAIGPDGPAAGVEVSLPDPLAGFALPAPPEGEDLAAAVRASLALLDGLAPDRITFPLLAAVYRAALGEAPGPLDFALHLTGPHGAGKSELAALAQRHFGAALDARHLPGGWSSTGNALEGLAFAAKDALLTVDDYAPRGAIGDRQRLEREADRLLRAQGNRAGRQRMRADGGLRPAKPPRGLILSTGEDVPPGQSLRGRMLILEVSPGDVPLARLTAYQRAAAAGRYAQALAGFLRWLAPEYGELAGRLPGERSALRERAQIGSGSARTPGIVADLVLGLQMLLDFGLAVGAISPAERDALTRRGWAALQAAAAAQAEHVRAAEPCDHFLRLLAAALASGRAHVAGPHGSEPEAPERWGWRLQTFGSGLNERTEWRPQGDRIGWVAGEDLYLEPEASYMAAQQLARDQGDALPVSPRTLRKRLKERGLLAEADTERQVLTVRRTLEGQRRDVLHLSAGLLSAEKPDQPDQHDGATEQASTYAGRVAGTNSTNGRPTRPADPTSPTNPTSDPTSENGYPAGTCGQLVGLVGSCAGETEVMEGKL